MKHILSILILHSITILLAWGGNAPKTWVYDGSLEAALEDARKIVLLEHRNPKKEPKELLAVLEPDAVAGFVSAISIQATQEVDFCFCAGFPAVEVHKEDGKVVRFSIQHGEAIRYGKFPGDARLTTESSKRLLEWLISNGVSGEGREFQKKLKELTSQP